MLTVTADDKSKTYGDSNPAFTATITGFVNSQDLASSGVTGTPALSTAATTTSNVGPYPISAGIGTLASANYSFTPVAGTLTITKATPVLTWNNPADITYGTALGATQLNATASVAGVFTYTPAAGTKLAAGIGQSLSVSFAPTNQTNYTVPSPASASINVNKATLAVTADNKTKAYDGQVYTGFTYTPSGFVNGDNSSVIGGSVSYSGLATTAVNASTTPYTLTPVVTGLTAANYSFAPANGSLTIDKATASIALNNLSQTYNGAAHSATASTSVAGTPTSMTGVNVTYTGTAPTTYATSTTAPTNAGSYTVVASLTNDNYQATNTTGTLVIAKANAAVNVTPYSGTYDGASHGLSGTASGVVLSGGGNENLNSGLSLGAVYTNATGANGTSVGWSFNGGTNYNDQTGTSTVTILAKAASVTPQANGKIYGGSEPVLSGTLSGFLMGDNISASYSRATGETVAGGPYAISGTLSPLAALANYSIAYNTAPFTISARAVTITADAQSKTYGAADPALTYAVTAGSLATGDAFTGSLTRASGENVGSYAISQGTVALNSNYALSYTGADLSITQKSLTVTATSQTKTYGNSDPALTFTYSEPLPLSAFAGALTRAAGESVGSYAINKGTLSAGGNYSLTYVPANLNVTARPIAITADAKSKTYGAADPGLTYQITSGSLAFADAFAGDLIRVSGENVGNHAINQGSVSLGTNYALTYHSANLAITARAVAITAEAQNKTYGDADPALTYQITSGNLVNGDLFTGSLARAAGEAAGPYAINQGTLVLNDNYALNYTGNNFLIGQRAVTVAADAGQNKIYGNTDPTLTYHISSGSLAFADAFTGTLRRAAGESVGNYAIQQGSLALNSNYALQFTSGSTFAIGTRAVTVTADAQSKIYGDATPPLTYQVTSGSLATGDSFTGALARAAGENVGGYAIAQGTLTAGTNYNLTYAPANLTITPRGVTVAADAKSKTYGDTDPSFTYHITGGSLAFTDGFTGGLSRQAGESVGTYGITQGTLSAGTNYNLTYNGNNLTIAPLGLTITAAPKSKVYGSLDPALTYALTNTATGTPAMLVTGDSFSGVLTRTTGENVGAYAISSTLANSNYVLTYRGADLSITPKTLTVTATAQAKTYGDADPTFTYTNSESLAAAAFSGQLVRTNLSENVGSYAISQGTLSAGDNYFVNFVPANLTIGTRAITITADAKSKTYGNADPALTYQVTTGSLVSGDAFAGNLVRTSGESVGNYDITQGSVALSNNYALSFVSHDLSIGTRAVTITAAPQTKVYGANDPDLTYSITTGSLATGDAFSGNLTRADAATAAGENVGGYAITQGTVALNTNYVLSYAGANLSITARPIAITADAKSKTYGDSDPGLTYQITSGTLAFADAFTGNLTRAGAATVAGENVGTYAINKGTVALTGNYALTYHGADLVIGQRALAVKADAKTKVYGDAAPSLTYQVTSGNLVTGDSFSGALTRAAGENVGSYAITQGTLTAGTNYNLTYSGDNLNITPRPVTITAAAKTKVYGASDPTLTYQITSGTLAFADAFTGSLTRATGENVGTYAIGKGSVALSSNYALSYVGDNLSITPKSLTITADAKTKVYGAALPTFTASYTGLANGDSAPATVPVFATTAFITSPVGPYTITASSAADANYTISYVAGTLTITPKALTVTASALDKVYDGSTTATVTLLDNRLPGDKLTAAYTSATFSDANAGNNKTVTVSGISISGSEAGNYTVNSTAITTANITPQNAFPVADTYYTGSSFYWTTSATSNTATLTLVATLKNNPNLGSGNNGNIRTARVTFAVRNSTGGFTPISSAQNLPVGLVNPGDLTTGTASATAQYTINGSTATLEIAVIVSGNYSANDPTKDKIVVISVPTPGGLITGGGTLNPDGAAGFIKPASLADNAAATNTTPAITGAEELPTQFGFGVQYSKSLRNPQGNVEITVKSYRDRTGALDVRNGVLYPHTYRLKSNAISVLAITAATSTAQFSGKANIAEIVNGVEQSIEGNCTIQLDMTQHPTNPLLSVLAVTINRNAGGVWYSSKWDGTKTVTKCITSGYLSVTGSGTNSVARMALSSDSAAATTTASTAATKRETAGPNASDLGKGTLLELYPNPMAAQGTVHFHTEKGGKAQVYLYNQLGALVATLYNAEVQSGQEYYVPLKADELAAGVYTCRLISNGKVENRRINVVR
ncbi:T9SS type A sorting domain-containing protein [Hymenobacter sp. BT189]|uniref:T9SS type A sorting domain-containing protein n=1 Tax=Hymenobacter armeniacus TaxID=2771358 RepID=A0ABR8JUL6_9BACT|nr:T9SS type A sorting domain-containing protein [Hymenobacter armeniacus]